MMISLENHTPPSGMVLPALVAKQVVLATIELQSHTMRYPT
jgi:hypothetical protein